MLNPTWLRIFRDTFISISLCSWMKIVCLCKCFTEFYFFYWLLVAALAIFFFKIALLVVIMQSNMNIACGSTQTAARSVHLITQAIAHTVQTSNSSHCKFGACQRLYRWFWRFFNVFSENPFLPCLPHRSRLFRLNSPDIMKFSSWKSLKMWSIL